MKAKNLLSEAQSMHKSYASMQECLKCKKPTVGRLRVKLMTTTSVSLNREVIQRLEKDPSLVGFFP